MFDANEVINGLYGFVYDENGKQMQETKAFEANVDYDKEEVLQAGKLMKGHKVIAASGAGTITAHKIDSTATEDIPEIQYDNSKTQSSSCKGKTTTALHVRKGAGTNYASKGVWPKGTSLSIKIIILHWGTDTYGLCIRW